MFKKRRASSSATNAMPCGLTSNRRAMRSIVPSDRHSLGANERTRLGRVRWLRRRWYVSFHRVGYGLLPFFLFRLGFLSAGFVLTLQLRDLLFASPFDQRQDAPGNVQTGCLAGTGKADTATHM